MTVLMTDARAALSAEARHAYDKEELEDALFADDTLLISRCSGHLEEYMARVEEKGRDYGLQMHWGKVCLVRVGFASHQVHTPQGEPIQAQDSMLYLGSTVHANGKFGCEISRKIGAARAEFDFLHRIWKSSALPQSRKLQIFDALNLIKLRYGVSSSWLSKSELRVWMVSRHVACEKC